ncbi:LacI family DNA-binding transcriptional regulator [Sinomonas sp. G460-2]|uniref:LacI family DNA-binding transcriptional regulator n=1 Tax=Sinomonas sp. G460-2 TaxID=3393464 RepID=UPI0039EE5403
MNSGPRKRPTMIDVGRRAEVSAQTVSRYFNGGYVSTDSRARIEAAVSDLGYRQNRLPRQLRGDRTESIGFLSLGPINYGNASILMGLNHAARAHSQTLVTSHFEPDPADPKVQAELFRDIDRLLSMRVDGLVIATPFVGGGVLVDYVKDAVPVILLSEGGDGDAPTVHSRSYAAARLAVRHLIELGHRDILHLGGPANRNESHTRRRAYQDELASAALTPLPILECAEWDAASGAACAETIDPTQFTAVFAANDEIALGFSSVLHGRGFTAPRDYSIVGFDDMPEARYFTPPLTSSRIDFERIGEAALLTVLSLVRGEAPKPNYSIEPALIVRESTAPPSSAKP